GCLPQTILHDAMDELEEGVTLSEVNTTTIEQYCIDRWNLVYPRQNNDDKKLVFAYCECAKTKLLDIIKKIDELSNKEYEDAIKNINMLCSGNLKK
ncbi:hypothetical protein EP47_02085, partial [Legionella norrlandica]